MFASERSRIQHQDVNEIVADMLAGVRPALGASFVAMYLGGSLATGTFTPETSDIDFVIVTEHSVSGAFAAKLRSAHERITGSPSKWAKKLEILYVPMDTMRTRHASTQQCAYLGVGGSFAAAVPYQSDWIIQIHLVREHGVVVAGPAPKALIGPITSEDLRSSCEAIMRD